MYWIESDNPSFDLTPSAQSSAGSGQPVTLNHTRAGLIVGDTVTLCFRMFYRHHLCTKVYFEHRRYYTRTHRSPPRQRRSSSRTCLGSALPGFWLDPPRPHPRCLWGQDSFMSQGTRTPSLPPHPREPHLTSNSVSVPFLGQIHHNKSRSQIPVIIQPDIIRHLHLSLINYHLM